MLGRQPRLVGGPISPNNPQPKRWHCPCQVGPGEKLLAFRSQPQAESKAGLGMTWSLFDVTTLPTLCVCQVQINRRRPRRDYAQEQALSSWPKWHPRTECPLHAYSFLDISFSSLEPLRHASKAHDYTRTLTQQINALSNQWIAKKKQQQLQIHVSISHKSKVHLDTASQVRSVSPPRHPSQRDASTSPATTVRRRRLRSNTGESAGIQSQAPSQAWRL